MQAGPDYISRLWIFHLLLREEGKPGKATTKSHQAVPHKQHFLYISFSFYPFMSQNSPFFHPQGHCNLSPGFSSHHSDAHRSFFSILLTDNSLRVKTPVPKTQIPEWASIYSALNVYKGSVSILGVLSPSPESYGPGGMQTGTPLSTWRC